MQFLRKGWTTWHITWGTYGARLHGGDRATVDREQNQPGSPGIDRNEAREHHERGRMRGPVVLLTDPQRLFIEAELPALCERGDWGYRTAAAGPECDHVHVLCDVRPEIHGKQVMRWFKTWLTQALQTRWPRPIGGRWWAAGGSTKVVGDESYLNNAFDYLAKQRAIGGR